MKYSSLSLLVASSSLLACVQVKAPIAGGYGSGLSEISMNLPDVAKITSDPEQQKLLTGYKFIVEPKTQGANCTALTKTSSWADAKIDAKILQGCDYVLKLEIGNYEAAPAQDQNQTPIQDTDQQAGDQQQQAGQQDNQPAQQDQSPTTPESNGVLKAIYYAGAKELLATEFANQPSINVSLQIYVTAQGKQLGFPGEQPITIASQGTTDVQVDVSIAGANNNTADALATLQQGNQEVALTGQVSFANAVSPAIPTSGYIVAPGVNAQNYFTIISGTPPANCAATAIKLKTATQLSELHSKQLKTKVTLIKKTCGTATSPEIYAVAIEEL